MPTWLTPRTFIAGALLRASELNDFIRDNARVLRTQFNNLETVTSDHSGRVGLLESSETAQDMRAATLEATNDAELIRISASEAADVSQNSRINTIGLKDSEGISHGVQATQNLQHTLVFLRTNALERAFQTIDSDIDSLEDRVADLLSGDTTSGATNAQTAVRLTGIEGNIGNLQSSAGSLNTRIGTLEGTVSSVGGRMSTAEGEVSTLQSQVMALMSDPDAGALPGRVTTLENTIASLESDVSGLNGRMGTAESNIGTLQGQISTLMNSPSSPAPDPILAGRVTTAEQDIDAVQASVGTRAYGSSSVWQELQSHFDSIQEIEADYRALDLINSIDTRLSNTISDDRDDIRDVIMQTRRERDFIGEVVSKLGDMVTAANLISGVNIANSFGQIPTAPSLPPAFG